MAKKKYKKRQHSPTVAAKRQQGQERLADEKARAGKRFDPTARALLLTDLVFLALVSLLDMNDIIPDVVSGVCTVMGVVLLIIALWFQFGNKKDGPDRGTRL